MPCTNPRPTTKKIRLSISKRASPTRPVRASLMLASPHGLNRCYHEARHALKGLKKAQQRGKSVPYPKLLLICFGSIVSSL